MWSSYIVLCDKRFPCCYTYVIVLPLLLLAGIEAVPNLAQTVLAALVSTVLGVINYIYSGSAESGESTSV